MLRGKLLNKHAISKCEQWLETKMTGRSIGTFSTPLVVNFIPPIAKSAGAYNTLPTIIGISRFMKNGIKKGVRSIKNADHMAINKKRRMDNIV